MGAATATETKPRIDTQSLITNKFIEKLSKGIVPWHEPWGQRGHPVNLVNGHPYQGINALLLGMEGFKQNEFLTFDQVNNLGGKVTKGAKGYAVVSYGKPKNAGSAQSTETEQTDPKHYTVFNVSQCEKIPAEKLPAPKEPMVSTGYPLIAKAMPNCPKIAHKGQQAYYDVVEDVIYIPKLRSEANESLYYAQLFHLLIHSTGHDSRLARSGVAEMAELAPGVYSKEELVAEIGTCFLLSHAGISLGYQSKPEHSREWLAKLHEDKEFIFTAAREAQLAFEYVLDIKTVKDNAENKRQ